MKVLFIGLGGIGQRHCRNLREKFGDDADILAYRVRKLTQTVTPTLGIEEGVDVNEKYGVRVFDDLENALEEKPDVTFVTNPSSLHIPVAMAAAKAGSHLFIEKPLSHSLYEVDALIQLCQSKNLVGFVAYQLRFYPGIERIRSLLSENALGSLLSVHAEVGEYLPGWHKYEDYRQMYAARKDLGGGVIISQIHEFDYLYDWFGLPQSVYAIGGQLSSLEIDTEDTAKILMQMNVDGKLLPVSLHMDYNQRPPSRGCKIVGEEGKLELDFVAGTLTHTKPDGEQQTEDYSQFERNIMFTKELDHFFDCVEGKAKPLVSLEDGASSLRMAVAAKKSLETGQVVELEGKVLS